MKRKYGHIKDRDIHPLLDTRLRYAAKPETIQALPPSVDLTPLCPEVWDQGESSACTAHALAAAHYCQQKKQAYEPPGSWRGASPVNPCRLFLYWGERVIEGSTAQDCGAMPADGITVLQQTGIAPEEEDPFDATHVLVPPPAKCAADSCHKVTLAVMVHQTLQEMRSCLAEGFPFTVGIQVYKSFEDSITTSTGDVQTPDWFERLEGALGGHDILIVGYDDTMQRFKFRNSWGTAWGEEGYGTISYDYLCDPKLADSFWSVQGVEP